MRCHMEPSFQKQLIDVNGLPHKSIPVIIPGENFKINEKRSISNINQTNLIVWYFYKQTKVIYLSAKTRGSPEPELIGHQNKPLSKGDNSNCTFQ